MFRVPGIQPPILNSFIVGWHSRLLSVFIVFAYYGMSAWRLKMSVGNGIEKPWKWIWSRWKFLEGHLTKPGGSCNQSRWESSYFHFILNWDFYTFVFDFIGIEIIWHECEVFNNSISWHPCHVFILYFLIKIQILITISCFIQEHLIVIIFFFIQCKLNLLTYYHQWKNNLLLCHAFFICVKACFI